MELRGYVAGAVKSANGTIQPGNTSTTSNPPSSSGGGGGGYSSGGGGGYSGGGGGNDPTPDPNPLPSGEIDFNDIEELISAGMVEIIQNESGDLRVIDGTFTTDIVNNVIEKINGLNNIVQICSGGSSYEVYALSSDGKMYVWGHSSHNYGNAGTPHYSTYSYPDLDEPVTVVDYYDFTTPHLISTGIISMSEGAFGLLAKKNDNSMWLWRGSDGKQIDFGNDVVSFACAVGWNRGCDYALFLKSDGSLWTYGYDSYYDADHYNLTPIILTDGVMLPKTQ